MKINRNSDGVVTADVNGEAVTAKVSQTQSIIGVVGMNGLTNNGDYRDDGWVYVDGKPIKKWHVNINGIRVWEPHLNDLTHLYHLYKRATDARQKGWEYIHGVLKQIWERGPVKNNEAIAHFFSDARKTWWRIVVSNEGNGKFSLGIDFLDEKPAKVINQKLGQPLSEYVSGRWDAINKRCGKAEYIFFQAMQRSLPEPNRHTVMALHFGNDTFIFYTAMYGSRFMWNQFEHDCKLENKQII